MVEGGLCTLHPVSAAISDPRTRRAAAEPAWASARGVGVNQVWTPGTTMDTELPTRVTTKTVSCCTGPPALTSGPPSVYNPSF